MAIPFRCFVILGVLFMCLSCNSVLDPGPADAGTYTLQATTPSCILSYGGGGGLFILSMRPSEDLAGNVLLSVVAPSALHAQISPEVLTLDKQVAEVTLRPDTTVALGDFPIRVITTHAEASDTLILEVKVLAGKRYASLGYSYAIRKRDEFVTWLQAEHPELGIEMGQDWFRYVLYPGISGSGVWTFLNSDWEMTVGWTVWPSPSPSWLLLRKRGEAEPTLSANREPDGTIHEIPVGEHRFFIPNICGGVPPEGI